MLPKSRKHKLSAGVEDATQQSSAGHDNGEPRRSHRMNLGKNGRTEQLQRVGAALEQKACQKSQATMDVLSTAPVNPMALIETSSKGKRRKHKDQNEVEGHVSTTDAPIPSFHVAGAGERFGFYKSTGTRRKSPVRSSSPPPSRVVGPESDGGERDDGHGKGGYSSKERVEDEEDRDCRFDSGSDPDADMPHYDYEAPAVDNDSDPLQFPPSSPPAQKATGMKTEKPSVRNESAGSCADNSTHHNSEVARKPRTRNESDVKTSRKRDNENFPKSRTEEYEGDDDDASGNSDDLKLKTSRERPPVTAASDYSVHSRPRKDTSKLAHPSHKVSGAGHHRSQKDSRPVRPADSSHNVLQRHQSKNGHLRPPSPTHLQRIRSKSAHSRQAEEEEEEEEEEEDVKTLIGGRSASLNDPTCLSFYPPLTKAFLRRCKVLVRAHYAMHNPFITLEDATQGIGLEILAEVHVEYTKKRLALESGQYPQQRHSMSRMLYNENGNFRSELKRHAMAAVSQHYKELQIPEGSRWTAKQGIEYVKQAAERLLRNGDWLRGPPDKHGKLRNFSHDAIKHACLTFYYRSSSRASLRSCKAFSATVPPHAVSLVTATIKVVLAAYRDHGQPKVPTINEESCGRALRNANKAIEDVLANPSHAKHFRRMLQDWVQQERFDEPAGDSNQSDSDFGLVFD